MSRNLLQNFCNSSVKIQDAQSGSIFYVYVDAIQSKMMLPKTLEEAYANGFLVIEKLSSNLFLLMIGNESYENQSIEELNQLLFQWSLFEGYQW
jgi:hypothetical protein